MKTRTYTSEAIIIDGIVSQAHTTLEMVIENPRWYGAGRGSIVEVAQQTETVQFEMEPCHRHGFAGQLRETVYKRNIDHTVTDTYKLWSTKARGWYLKEISNG